MTNGLSHPSHLDESNVIFKGTRCDFSFFDENYFSKQNNLRWDIWGYSVCICPIKKDARLIWVNEGAVDHSRVSVVLAGHFL